MNFRQNFSQKQKIFRHFRKTLAETVHYIPKGLRKGNPFHGPFAQLSHVNQQPCDGFEELGPSKCMHLGWYTLPKFNSAPLKHDAWKTIFSFWVPVNLGVNSL